ncbi:hypothetical protein [Phytohabitans rumicis]|uniref:Uncharacterized protein n=1 Tax=Phytohabitans rumicis TaxID=1076125 RepID=A0A6V8KTZ4_9ACTN|nr:hypothetical protein [Phytohabitans rumicis]GFJ87294.1 hypothetical protein Prum_009360 [Phytohabitans rumicis]
MRTFDVRDVVKAPDELLARTDNPRHRAILTNFRRHALLEVSGRWQEILTPRMVVDRPVYRINENGRSVHLTGLDEIGKFYQDIADRGLNVFGPIEERIAIADWGLAIESLFGNYLPGHVLAAQGEDVDDPDAWYQLTHYMASFWPYDEDCRLIGEHIYEDAASRTIEKLRPEQVVTPAMAARILTPLID